MKGLCSRAIQLGCDMPRFIENRYPSHVYEFVNSRAKLDGVYLRKVELIQLISTVNNELAMTILKTKFISYEDVAMHLLRCVLQCSNVYVLSSPARIRVALLNE